MFKLFRRFSLSYLVSSLVLLTQDSRPSCLSSYSFKYHWSDFVCFRQNPEPVKHNHLEAIFAKPSSLKKAIVIHFDSPKLHLFFFSSEDQQVVN